MKKAVAGKSDSYGGSRGWNWGSSYASLPTVMITLLSVGLLAGYFIMLWQDIGALILDPNYTTDDALQQVFPFYKIIDPELFAGDLITSTMEGYLAPLHYWICAGITWLTGSPLRMADIVMVLQLTITSAFLFLIVRRYTHTSVGLLAVTWFLHTRPVVQRMTAGLPRGWAAPVLAAVLYFISKGNHRAVLLALFCGCLLHPPATLIAALCYGLYLLYCVARRSTRSATIRPFVTLVLLSPLYIATTAWVVHRPDEVGQMVDYATADSMPEFHAGGRFAFLPLDKVNWELKSYAFQPFVSRLHRPGVWWGGEYISPKEVRDWVVVAVTGTFAAMLLVGLLQRRTIVPVPVMLLGVSSIAIYFLSRALAFKLYVPNRHLQLPLAVFWITAVLIGVWKLLRIGRAEGMQKVGRFVAGYGLLTALVVFTSGDGLAGPANFNYHTKKRGEVFEWLRKFSPKDALVAGHPTHIDGVMLFAQRRGFATTETAHPFYPKYFAEMKRRLEISLRAHYATSLREFVDLLRPEGIDYFVFSKQRFYPEALQRETYFAPLHTLVEELAARDRDQFVYINLPKRVNLDQVPYLLFRDHESALVDVRALDRYLAERSGQQSQSEVTE